MLGLFRKRGDEGLTRSILLDNRTFYAALLKDLDRYKSEIMIESPFTTHKRLNVKRPQLPPITEVIEATEAAGSRT